MSESMGLENEAKFCPWCRKSPLKLFMHTKFKVFDRQVKLITEHVGKHKKSIFILIANRGFLFLIISDCRSSSKRRLTRYYVLVRCKFTKGIWRREKFTDWFQFTSVCHRYGKTFSRKWLPFCCVLWWVFCSFAWLFIWQMTQEIFMLYYYYYLGCRLLVFRFYLNCRRLPYHGT